MVRKRYLKKTGKPEDIEIKTSIIDNTYNITFKIDEVNYTFSLYYNEKDKIYSEKIYKENNEITDLKEQENIFSIISEKIKTNRSNLERK